MTKLFDMLKLDDEGQTLTEYAILLILVAVVVVLMITVLSGTINNTYSEINSAMP